MRPQSLNEKSGNEKSGNEKSGKQNINVLGRSAATGRVVLKPASKAGSISVRDAAAAVRRIHEAKKK